MPSHGSSISIREKVSTSDALPNCLYLRPSTSLNILINFLLSFGLETALFQIGCIPYRALKARRAIPIAGSPSHCAASCPTTGGAIYSLRYRTDDIQQQERGANLANCGYNYATAGSLAMLPLTPFTNSSARAIQVRCPPSMSEPLPILSDSERD